MILAVAQGQNLTLVWALMALCYLLGMTGIALVMIGERKRIMAGLDLHRRLVYAAMVVCVLLWFVPACYMVYSDIRKWWRTRNSRSSVES